MSRRVHLHIGAPKTGTTAIQTRLQRNAANLARHGVLVPRGTGARPAGLAFRASLELMGMVMGQDPALIEGSWDELVGQVHGHDGPVVISHEGFVRCDEDAVARVVEALGHEAELHVIYSARALGRQLVSGWLEGLKNGGTTDLATHFDRARTGELWLQASFDVPAVLGRWLTHLPAERVHLVTVAPPGGDRSALWRRFGSLTGIDDSWVPTQPSRINESFGIPEAQVLLALNRLLDGSNRRGGPHQRVVRRTVVGQGLAGRDSPRPGVPPSETEWLDAEIERWIAWVLASGVDVVGDLAELRSDPVPVADWVDPDVPHPATTEAALAALTALVVEAEHRGSPVGPGADPGVGRGG
ncbi:hypothetical protein [Nocardioides sp.]|uniref:hypothetical protein n=1 Tax=Nocardioides sp. TaxID=35761 RepID=UPI002B27BF2E|nr:hypothetical protein [Nocardioides sp.]